MAEQTSFIFHDRKRIQWFSLERRSIMVCLVIISCVLVCVLYEIISHKHAISMIVIVKYMNAHYFASVE